MHQSGWNRFVFSRQGLKQSDCTCIGFLAAGLVSKPKVRYLLMAALCWFYFLIGPFLGWAKVLSKHKPLHTQMSSTETVAGCRKWRLQPKCPHRRLCTPKPYGLTHPLSCKSLGDCDPVVQVLKILVAYLQFLATDLNLKSNVRLLWAGAEFCRCSVPSFIRKKKD